MYGDSVDNVIKGNTENIVFLKSTDDAMIENLVKMSGVTHETRRDQKTITHDTEKLLNKVDGKISYTISTKERPVISFNDFMFIKERNSIIIKAGVSPIWNHNETAYPMSWRLLKNQINIPGRKFTLQTLPTNSSAIDFDVRKNQPDFFKMLEKRLSQARMADTYRQLYLDRYGYSEIDLARLDQNVVADEIMDNINRDLWGDGSNADSDKEAFDADDYVMGEDEHVLMDDLGRPIKPASDMSKGDENTELTKEAAGYEMEKQEHERKRYAGNSISRNDLVVFGSGGVNHQLKKVIAKAYDDTKQYFRDTKDYRVKEDTSELISSTNEYFTRSTKGEDADDMKQLVDGQDDVDSKVYGEVDDIETFFEVTDEFLKYLADQKDWKDIAGGRFDQAVQSHYSRM